MTQPLLSTSIEEPEYVDPGSDLGNRIAELENRVRALESSRVHVKRDAVVLVLNLLAKSLKHVAEGKFDLSVMESPSTDANSKWDAVKKRLQPRLAEAIDILMLQGAMRRTQLAAAMKMDYSNCTKNVIAVLTRQGLVIESGGQLSLKEL